MKNQTIWQKLTGTPWTEHNLLRLPAAASPNALRMETGQGRGLSCLSHFFLHQLASLASITCLVWLVSEFTSPDLTASVSPRPHHPILSASHLASTPLILSHNLPCARQTASFISNSPSLASET